MKVLLDTHTFLWFIMGDSQLSEQARVAIEDAKNIRVISIASIWEMAIKISKGSLTIDAGSFSGSFADFMDHYLAINCIGILDITLHHAERVSVLPFPSKHKDPFDRVIIAQSLVENIPIVGRDEDFDSYSVERIW